MQQDTTGDNIAYIGQVVPIPGRWNEVKDGFRKFQNEAHTPRGVLVLDIFIKKKWHDDGGESRTVGRVDALCPHSFGPGLLFWKESHHARLSHYYNSALHSITHIYEQHPRLLSKWDPLTLLLSVEDDEEKDDLGNHWKGG